jgi:radical SAM enzyme (TIGR01210 family)
MVKVMNERHIVIPIFVPHKGCPNDCIFCNQKTISGQQDEMTEEKMRIIIDSHIKTAPKSAYMEIGFYGGSFTGIDKEQQLIFLKIANEYIRTGKVKEIRLSTRPDYINKEIMEYLRQYQVKTIELGVQSLDDEVLKKSNRGHSVDDVYKAANLINKFGFNLGIQTMIGLPGSNDKKDLITANRVIELSPKIIRIYPTLVVKNTVLEKLYYEKQYTPLELNDAVLLCAELLEMYESKNIKVIRIGLQGTDNINEKNDVVAGPFHPAFRQLVESSLSLKKIEKYIIESKQESVKNIVIYVENRSLSNAIGQKKSNIIYLKEKYGFSDIRIIGQENTKSNTVTLH